MKLIIYQSKISEAKDFVTFWEGQYNDPLEHLYIDNIGKPLTPDGVHPLFEWKNGSRLSAQKYRSVEQNFVGHIAKASALPQGTDATEFLQAFPLGGAIWRIFWLHCWQPDRFPIYDQHVHRAMSIIEQDRPEELPVRDGEKVRQYLTRYLPFHQKFQGFDQRSLDKAFWSFGKFVKANRFP